MSLSPCPHGANDTTDTTTATHGSEATADTATLIVAEGEGELHGERENGSAVETDKNKSSTVQAFFNMVTSFLGAGILGLPHAFHQGGIMAAAICLVCIAVLSNYCIRLLLQCRNRLAEKGLNNLHSYGDIGEHVLGKLGRAVVDMALVFTQLGVGCVYLIFIGRNLHSLVPSLTLAAVVMMAMPPLAAMCLFRSLKYLAPMSIIAQVNMMLGLLMIWGYASFEEKRAASGLHWGVQWSSFPLFFGIAVYTYEGIGLALPIERSMLHKERYGFVLNACYAFITGLFLLFGIAVYLGFGDSTQSVITLNLPDNLLSVFVKLTLCVCLLFTYPMMMVPVIQISEAYFLNQTTPMVEAKRNVLRILVVITTGIVAISIPNFGAVMGLIGDIGSSLLAFILPALFYLRIFEGQLTRGQFIRCWSVLIFGLTGAITGAVTTFLEMETQEEGQELTP